MKKKKELFIVEGLSAASTIRQVMHKPSQDVLAIQGKLINAQKVSLAKIKTDLACQSLFQTLGCGTGNSCHPQQLNYSRIFILTDPDVDGVHVRLLLFNLFDRYLKALIDSGLVHVIIPPLFRISDKKAKSHIYAWSQSELDDVLKKSIMKDVDVMQYKSVAQLTGAEGARLMKPETRKQYRLVIE